jgi:ribose-phosphate pyrophosphokinase
MGPLIFALPGNESFAEGLRATLSGERGSLETRAFPDGESYVRLACDPAGKDVVVVCTLNRPDAKILSLLFVAATARELGARSIGLVAPYLAYMRQDKRFRDGEAVTSVHFARLVSQAFDWLVTVDPHLHRYGSLSEVYSIPSVALHAGAPVASWIRRNVDNPLIVGPDVESEQWVLKVAAEVGAPYRVLTKVRTGDRRVAVSLPDLSGVEHRTPVLVDDILSSGRTMIEACSRFRECGAVPPVCIAVHALAGPEIVTDLLGVARRFVSTNAVPNPYAEIDLATIVAEGVNALLAKRTAL